jgi:hypothetical protein
MIPAAVKPRDKRNDWLKEQLSQDFLTGKIEMGRYRTESERDIGKFLVALNAGGVAFIAAMLKSPDRPSVSLKSALVIFFFGVCVSFLAVIANALRVRSADDKFTKFVLGYHDDVFQNPDVDIEKYRAIIKDNKRFFWGRCYAISMRVCLIVSAFLFLLGCIFIWCKVNASQPGDPAHIEAKQTGTDQQPIIPAATNR